jgi:cation:H+ antiporter
VDLQSALSLLAGLVLLILGGELLVRGGSGLGRAMGLSPLVVGLTIVAFATSAPELAVSLDATLSGSPGLAVGQRRRQQHHQRPAGARPVGPAAARGRRVAADPHGRAGHGGGLRAGAADRLDGAVGRVEGVLLVVLLVAYVAWILRLSRRQGIDLPVPGAAVAAAPRPLRDAALVVVGVALLVLGARLLVGAATEIAGAFGVSDLVIGLTVVAVGTSLPELATSVIAAVRGQREMAIGNVVGSNIFNLTVVLGLTAAVAPGGVPVDPAALRFDLPVMVAVAVALVPIVFTGRVIARWEAGVFLAYFGVYVGYLLLQASDHDALPAFSAVMLAFVVPITVLTLVVLMAYEVGVRKGRRQQQAEAEPAGVG